MVPPLVKSGTIISFFAPAAAGPGAASIAKMARVERAAMRGFRVFMVCFLVGAVPVNMFEADRSSGYSASRSPDRMKVAAMMLYPTRFFAFMMFLFFILGQFQIVSDTVPWVAALLYAK